MTSLVPMASAVAQMQGVTIGSKAYRAAGLHPYASQTGGHAAYGWNHGYKVDDAFAKAAIVNALSRPLYYDDENYRESGYNIACRPDGWEPEDANDVATGWHRGRRRFQTPSGAVTVSAFDPQHLWGNPLFEIVALRNDAAIQVMGGTVPAWRVAKWCLRHYVRAVAGMVRKDGPWLAGGRATALILNFTNQAMALNLFAQQPKEGEAIIDWIENYALPQLETAPGVREVKNEGVCRWVQECGWMLLPVYEAESGLASYKDFGSRFKAIRKRISQWMLDIDEIAGGRAKWYNLRITDAMRAGANGAPLPSLKGAITADDVAGPDDYTLWSCAAADVARISIGSQQAEDFYARVLAKAGGNASEGDQVWLVGHDRMYLS